MDRANELNLLFIRSDTVAPAWSPLDSLVVRLQPTPSPLLPPPARHSSSSPSESTSQPSHGSWTNSFHQPDHTPKCPSPSENLIHPSSGPGLAAPDTQCWASGAAAWSQGSQTTLPLQSDPHHHHHVRRQLRRLHSSKAAGPDGVSTRVHKSLCHPARWRTSLHLQHESSDPPCCGKHTALFLCRTRCISVAPRTTD